MNQKLLEQLALAKEAGSNSMAKDFFAKTPGAGGAEPSQAGPTPDDGQAAGQDPAMGGQMGGQPGQPGQDDAGGEGKMTPQLLEELLQLLGAGK